MRDRAIWCKIEIHPSKNTLSLWYCSRKKITTSEKGCFCYNQWLILDFSLRKLWLWYFPVVFNSFNQLGICRGHWFEFSDIFKYLIAFHNCMDIKKQVIQYQTEWLWLLLLYWQYLAKPFDIFNLVQIFRYLQSYPFDIRKTFRNFQSGTATQILSIKYVKHNKSNQKLTIKSFQCNTCIQILSIRCFQHITNSHLLFQSDTVNIAETVRYFQQNSFNIMQPV